MKQMLVLIGGTEMYVPINERLGKLIMQAHKRLNYQKHIAAMRKAYRGRIEVNRVDMTTDFFYALEDVLEENGYHDVFHRHFEKMTMTQRKILYEIFREDKTVRFLVQVRGYEEDEVLNAIREFFESFKKQI